MKRIFYIPKMNVQVGQVLQVMFDHFDHIQILARQKMKGKSENNKQTNEFGYTDTHINQPNKS